MDRNRPWFCILFLLAAVAEKSKTDAYESNINCFKDNQGISPTVVSGGLCVLSTSRGSVIYGNRDLVEDPRADALSQKWNDTEYDPGWQLEVHPMMHDGQPVFGWFHIVVTGDPSTAGILILMAILDSDEFLSPPAGSFLWTNTKTGSCAESSGMDPNKGQFVPCNFAVDPLPFAGRIFVDAAKGSHSIPAKYDLNVKLIFPRCNIGNEHKILFRLLVIGKKGASANLLRYGETKLLTFTQRVSYVVAVDPFPPPDGASQCSGGNMPPYVNVSDVKDGHKAPRIIKGKNSCTSESCYSDHGWEGRCRPFPSSYVDYDYPCICTEQVAPNDSIKDYYNDYVPRVKAATIVCAGETNCTDALNQRMLYGEDVGSPIGIYIWGARKGHGLLMSVAAFLVYPLSAYFARYYKETYMKTRAVINLHVWYAAHICVSFIVLSFIISGMGVGIYGRLFYGHSTSLCGVSHRIFGWLGTILFLLGMVTSGFRIAPVPTRKIAIFVHFLTGMLYQVLNWLSMFTCVCIPGSPPGTEMLDKGEGYSFALFWLVTFVWLAFEIVMNILASLQIREADVLTESIPRRTQVFGLVYMPTLTPDATKDLVGNERRDFLLRLYILGNSIITVLAVILIIYPDDKGRYFGIMDLTHFRNGSNRFADNYDEYAELDDD